MKHLVFLITLFIAPLTFAASVTKVKGSQVILQLSGESFAAGQKMYLTSNGKKIAWVEIVKSRGNLALGKILKGRAVVGATTLASSSASSQAANGGTATNGSAESPRSRRGANPFMQPRWGILGGLAMNSMSLTAQFNPGVMREANLSMSGMSFNLKGFYDYDYSDLITIRAGAGMESFSAKGSATSALGDICGDGTTSDCKADFMYLDLDGTAQFNLSKSSSSRYWAGLGYAFLITMSKTINIPNLSATGSTNQMILIGGGADFALSGGSFIPVSLEYAYIPGENVKASSIIIRTGYGF